MKIRKAEAPWSAAYGLLEKAIAFSSCDAYAAGLSLWNAPAEIKETRGAAGASVLDLSQGGERRIPAARALALDNFQSK